MNKTMVIKRIIALCLIVMTLFALSGISLAKSAEEQMMDEYSENMEKVNDYIEKNIPAEKRATESASILQANQIKKNVGNEKWFGGQYLDENKVLHVVVTDKDAAADKVKAAGILSAATLNKIKGKTFENSPEVIIDTGTYSRIDLKDIMNTIYAKKAAFVDGCGIDEQANRVFVELENCNSEEIDRFKKEVIDSEAIVYKQSEGSSTPLATIYAGTRVWPTNTSKVTISTFAYKNGEFGFVTVGHTLGNTIRTAKYGGGSILGTTSSYNKTMGPEADGSWTKLNSGHTGMDGVAKIGSNITYYGYFDPGTYDPVVNATVVTYLGNTESVVQSTITAVDYYHEVRYSEINPNWSNIYGFDIQVPNVNCQGGDSGSPLIGTSSPLGLDGNYVIWGSLRTGSSTGYFCDIKCIINTLGLTCTMG